MTQLNFNSVDPDPRWNQQRIDESSLRDEDWIYGNDNEMESTENVFKAEDTTIQTLPSGATRSSANGKFDYEGFLHPAVLAIFANYMHKHRKQPDGSLRDSDNWQKGVGKNGTMKAMLRHMIDAWAIHRGFLVYKEPIPGGGEKTHYIDYIDKRPDTYVPVDIIDCLCGVLFNVNGYLLEEIRETGGAYAD